MDENRVALHDARTGKRLADLGDDVGDRGSPSAAFSRDGRRVVTVSDGGLVRVWDAATGRPVLQPVRVGHSVSTWAWAVSADATRMACHYYRRTEAEEESAAGVWDLTTGKQILAFPPLGVEAVALSPDGSRVAAAIAKGPGGEAGSALVWEVPKAPPAGKEGIHE